jgi:hypothetical protein
MPLAEEELHSDGTDEEWTPTAEECDGEQDDDFAKDGQITFENLQGVELSACDGDGNPLGPANPDRGLYKVAASFAKRGCDVTEESWKPADMSIFESFTNPPDGDVNNSNGAPYTTLVLPAALDDADPASVASMRCATIYELSDQTTQFFYLWPPTQELAMLQGCVEKEATEKELIEAGRRSGKGVSGLPESARQKLAAWQRPQYTDFTLSPYAYAVLSKKPVAKRKPAGKKSVVVDDSASPKVGQKASPKSVQRSLTKSLKQPVKKDAKNSAKQPPKPIPKADPKPVKSVAKVVAKPSSARAPKSTAKQPVSKQTSDVEPAVARPAPPTGPPPTQPKSTPLKDPPKQVKVPATPRKQPVASVVEPVAPSARRVLDVDSGTKRKLPSDFSDGDTNSTWKVLFELVKDGRRTYRLMEGSGVAPNSVSRAMETLSASIS